MKDLWRVQRKIHIESIFFKNRILKYSSFYFKRCHVIVLDPKVYESLPEPTDEENDMLDLAFGLTAT